MGHLYIWTSAKHDVVLQALGPAFSRIDDVPDNETVPFEMGEVIIPEEGDVCLVMGSRCLAGLQAQKLVHGGRAISSLRQKALVSPKGGWWVFSNDPFTIRTDAGAPSEIRQDVALACRLACTGSVDPELGIYREVQDFEDMVQKVNAIIEERGKCELACDTETLGLYPEDENCRLISIQFSCEAGHADVLFMNEHGDTTKFNKQCIDWLLTHPDIRLSGANWKYDSRWIRYALGIITTNLMRDTLIMGSMIDENRSNSLKNHAWEYTAMGGYDKLEDLGYDKARMDLVPRDILTEYAGADADVTFQSSAVMTEELAESKPLLRLYRRVVLPASHVFEEMERVGVAVDLEKFGELNQELEVEIEDLTASMLDMMPNKLKAKYADNLSLSRPKLIKDYFFSPYGLNLRPKVFTEKSGEPSTAKAHLMMFADVPEASQFVSSLERLNSASKTKSTFVDGFLKHLRSDGRLHPTYMLFVGAMFDDDDEDSGAVTGRTSCKEPAFQTVPKKTKWAKKIRACYPAPPGKCILAFDFSQGELKVVACIADEQNMLSAFANNMDLHIVTAAAFMDISYEAFLKLETADPFTYTLMRTGAKAGNFGLLYGMQEDGFREYARTVFGVTMSPSEAAQRRDTFFTLYPGLIDYHEYQKSFVKRHKYVESPLGRRRHLPLVDSPDGFSRSGALRQAINAPVQSCLNDLTMFALVEIKKAIPELDFFGYVHDQVLAYADADKGHEYGARAKEVMDNLPITRTLGWEHQLQFTSDGEIGFTNLAELQKL